MTKIEDEREMEVEKMVSEQIGGLEKQRLGETEDSTDTPLLIDSHL